MRRLLLILTLLLPVLTQAQNSNFPTSAYVYIGVAASLPTKCTIGQAAFATDATAGQNEYYCTSANTWTQQSAGGGGSGTVNAGTATHIAYYATSTTAVSDMGADFTFASHTITGGASAVLDMSAGTWKIPTGASFVATAASMFGYDTTSKNWHIWDNGADAIGCAFSSAPTTGDVVSVTIASGNVLCSDAGFLAANVPTQASNGTNGYIATYMGNNKALVAASALPNGITATTQTAADNSTKVATTAYVDGHYIANGTAAMNTGAITSGACATVVTVSASGVATTDVITAAFNTDPTAITGYGASATGAVLTIYPYPTANNVNFKVCNSTANSITPSALTLNWKVVR